MSFLNFTVLNGEKYFARIFWAMISYEVSDMGGRDWNHALALSINEKEKRVILMYFIGHYVEVWSVANLEEIRWVYMAILISCASKITSFLQHLYYSQVDLKSAGLNY